MKKIGEVSLLYKWRALPGLVDEDSGDCGAPLACRGLLQSSEMGLTTSGNMEYIIGDKSDERSRYLIAN